MIRSIESVIKGSLRKVGVDISYIDDSDPNMYKYSLLGAIAIQKPFNIVQIGANDGKTNDPIYEFVKNNQDHTNIVLLEPLEALIPYLKDNYSYHNSAEILNKAIAKDNASSIKIYRIKRDYWGDINVSYGENWPEYRVPTGVTTTDKIQLLKWVSGNVQSNADPENIVESVEVDVIQPMSIIDRSQNIDSVHLLQVDTEGLDDKIVYKFFSDNIYPNIINIESSHLSEKRQDKYDEHLINEGYKVYDYTDREKLAIMQ